MSNEKFTDLPTVVAATLADIICAVQSGTSVQQTLQQVVNLGLSNTILNFAGNPNGNVAGNTYQFCWDTTDSLLYICTSSGSTVTAVWTLAKGVVLPLSLAQGGTSAALTASNGGLFYSTASAGAILAGTATANQIPLSGANSAPSWSTATYPATTSINQLLYSSANNVIGGLASANNGVLVTSNSGVPSILAGTGSTGNILQSNAAAAPSFSTATFPSTAGTSGNVLVSNGTNWSSSASTGITALGAQSQALNMNTHQINNVVDPTSAQDAATKHYVDNLSLTGTSVYAASAASLGSVTQSGSGVGATLTNNGTQATFALDGVNPPVSSNVLIKNTATGMTSANEGIYTVTSVGSGASNWILTRSTTYDTPSKVNQTGLIIVQNGSTLSGTAWYNSSTIVTVDTTAFNFNQFGNISLPLSLAQGGTNASLTASNGGIFYSTASAGAILAGTATANQILMSGSSSAPSWSTATYPATSGSQYGILASTGTNFTNQTLTSLIDGGIANTQGDLLYRNSSAWVALSPGTSGQLLQTGGAAANPAWTTATYPATSGSQYGILASTGTNFTNQTLTSLIDGAIASTQGDILYRGASAWVALSPGTSGQFLQTQGSAANPQWATGTTNGFTTLNVQRFTSTGGFTYTPTASMKYCRVTMVGAGGGGGGSPGAASGLAAAGAGASGSGLQFIMSAAQIGASKTGSVGTGGTAGSAGSNPGGTGGNTTFADWTAAGGGGGAAGVNSITGSAVSGGASNANTTGTGTLISNITGATGNAGAGAAPGAANICISFNGGNSPFGLGFGSAIQVIASNAAGTGAGQAAQGVGGGGGGAIVVATNTNVAGAAGGNGIVIVEEFI